MEGLTIALAVYALGATVVAYGAATYADDWQFGATKARRELRHSRRMRAVAENRAERLRRYLTAVDAKLAMANQRLSVFTKPRGRDAKGRFVRAGA